MSNLSDHQFGEQLSLFDKGPPTANLPSTSETSNPPAQPFAIIGDTPSSSGYVNQASLPAGMTVREYSQSGVPQQKPRYEWVPTHQLSTAQDAVSHHKVNDLHNNMTYENKWEGQESQAPEGWWKDIPSAYRYADNQYLLNDGNHRTTAERHQGAMFHRLRTYDKSYEDITERRPKEKLADFPDASYNP